MVASPRPRSQEGIVPVGRLLTHQARKAFDRTVRRRTGDEACVDVLRSPCRASAVLIAANAG